jgi:DNA-directed RNA polymerase specialized sigma24 family protein
MEAEELWGAVASVPMPPAQLSTLIATYRRGRSEAEVVAEFGAPKGTVKSRGNAARARLRRDAEFCRNVGKEVAA